MNTSKAKILSKSLEQEISWILELNELLSEEKEVLATRQFDLLEEFANKKQALSAMLEESAKHRMILINHQDKLPAVALKEYLRECSEEDAQQVLALNSKLAECLIKCRELNTINGQVIANNLYVHQEIVNELTGNKPDALNIYNSNGNIKPSNNNRHHETV